MNFPNSHIYHLVELQITLPRNQSTAALVSTQDTLLQKIILLWISLNSQSKYKHGTKRITFTFWKISPKRQCSVGFFFSSGFASLEQQSQRKTWSCSDSRDNRRDTHISREEQCDGNRRWIIFHSENCVQKQFVMSLSPLKLSSNCLPAIRSFASVTSSVFFKQMKYACFKFYLFMQYFCASLERERTLITLCT